MEINMYSIRDTKTELFEPPTTFNTHGEAERRFKTLANNKEHTYGKHPEDFHLYYLGKFDIKTGKSKLNDAPEHVVHAINVLDS